MSEPTDTPPTLASYAAERGLYFRPTSFALPKATQLLRHGFMNEVSGLVRGDLTGGLKDAYLAQVAYVYEGRNDLKRSPFTLVLIQAPESLGFAVRVLCHDRDLSKMDMTNPDSEKEIIEADDRTVRLESQGFLERYALFADNDQDENSVWRLFAPTLIDWLTTSAPTDFSFELQDGALCCFVPGSLSQPEEIDALCNASARVLKEVSRIGEGGNQALQVDGDSRTSQVERELAAHTFSSPPKNVKAAAKEFKSGMFIGDEAWKFGAEAFFREQAKAAGFERIPISEFRGSHMQTFLPGELAHVAAGKPGGEFDNCFLILTNNKEYDTMGWTNLVADGRPPVFGGSMASGVSSEKGVTKMSMDGRSLFFSTLDGGIRDRSGEEIASFLNDCRGVLGAG